VVVLKRMKGYDIEVIADEPVYYKLKLSNSKPPINMLIFNM